MYLFLFVACMIVMLLTRKLSNGYVAKRDVVVAFILAIIPVVQFFVVVFHLYLLARMAYHRNCCR